MSTQRNQEDSVTITTVRDETGPLRQKEVTKAWHDHINKVEVVTEKVRKDYKTERGVKGVATIPDEITIGNRNGFQVRVSVDPYTYDGGLPDEVRGIPIKVVEAKETHLGSCGGTIDSIDPVYGGVEIDWSGTCAVPVYDEVAGAERMLTCAHIFDACSNDITGYSVNQGGDSFGTVDRYDATADWANVTPVEKTLPDNGGILEPDGTIREVYGWHSESAAYDMAQNNDDVWQLGTTTGLDHGYMTAINSDDIYEDCVDMDGEGVEADVEGGDGDSGGLMYTYTDNGKIVIMSVFQGWQSATLDSIYCRGSDNNYGKTSRGILFDHLYNEYNMYPL